MAEAILDLKNPYWDEVKDIVGPDEFFPQDGPTAGIGWQAATRRTHLVKKYSWTISNPEAVQFVYDHCIGKVIDPLAGTGYWAYLLNQLGVEVFASDKDLPEENYYHKGQETWLPIFQHDALEALEVYKCDTLLLSWVPYGSEIGDEIVRNFKGNRIIYIGEREGGCCGDDALFERLDSDWECIAEMRPVQWSGLHDYIQIYATERRFE